MTSHRGRANRRKGAEAERELLRHLGELIGQDLARNLIQTRDGGADNADTGWAIEIKRQQQAVPRQWWQQTVKQAREAGLMPALAYRANRQPWRVVVPLTALSEAFREDWDWAWTATLNLEAFAMLIREKEAA